MLDWGLCASAGEGFDTRVSRSTGMLGSGTYFAFAAEYSICGYAREVLPVLAWSRPPLAQLLRRDSCQPVLCQHNACSLHCSGMSSSRADAQCPYIPCIGANLKMSTFMIIWAAFILLRFLNARNGARFGLLRAMGSVELIVLAKSRLSKFS